jgi:hypothetical protein
MLTIRSPSWLKEHESSHGLRSCVYGLRVASRKKHVPALAMAGCCAEFDETRFELHYDSVQSLYLLFDTITEEKVYLKQGEWSIHCDDQHGPYVVKPDGESLWCCDLVEHIVVRHPTKPDEVIVLTPDGKRHSLMDFRRMHRSVSVPIKATGRGQPVPVTAFMFTNSTSGVYVRWSLPSLHKEFIPQADDTCSKWYQNWWAWWKKQLAVVGVDPVEHLRKPTVTKHTADGSELDAATRFLPAANISTFALILLLTRWASPSKSSKDKNADSLAGWSVCMQSVIATFFSDGEFDIAMFLDAATVVRPGLPMNGSDMCTLRIIDGIIDLTPLLECDVAAVVETMGHVRHFPDASRVPLCEALLAFEQAGRKALWLHKQLVFNVTCVVEAAIMASIKGDGAERDLAQDPDVALSSRGQMQRMRRRERLAIKMKVLPFSWTTELVAS